MDLVHITMHLQTELTCVFLIQNGYTVTVTTISLGIHSENLKQDRGRVFGLESYSRAKGLLEVEYIVDVIDLFFPRSIHRFTVLPGHHWTRESNLPAHDQMWYFKAFFRQQQLINVFSFNSIISLSSQCFSVVVSTVFMWCPKTLPFTLLS